MWLLLNMFTQSRVVKLSPSFSLPKSNTRIFEAECFFVGAAHITMKIPRKVEQIKKGAQLVAHLTILNILQVFPSVTRHA